MKKFFTVAVLLLSCATLSAQFPGGGRPQSPNANLVSVEAHADGSATFRIYAPNAQNVGLAGDIMAMGAKFEKAENGV